MTEPTPRSSTMRERCAVLLADLKREQAHMGNVLAGIGDLLYAHSMEVARFAALTEPEDNTQKVESCIDYIRPKLSSSPYNDEVKDGPVQYQAPHHEDPASDNFESTERDTLLPVETSEAISSQEATLETPIETSYDVTNPHVQDSTIMLPKSLPKSDIDVTSLPATPPSRIQDPVEQTEERYEEIKQRAFSAYSADEDPTPHQCESRDCIHICDLLSALNISPANEPNTESTQTSNRLVLPGSASHKSRRMMHLAAREAQWLEEIYQRHATRQADLEVEDIQVAAVDQTVQHQTQPASTTPSPTDDMEDVVESQDEQQVTIEQASQQLVSQTQTQPASTTPSPTDDMEDVLESKDEHQVKIEQAPQQLVSQTQTGTCPEVNMREQTEAESQFLQHISAHTTSLQQSSRNVQEEQQPASTAITNQTETTACPEVIMQEQTEAESQFLQHISAHNTSLQQPSRNALEEQQPASTIITDQTPQHPRPQDPKDIVKEIIDIVASLSPVPPTSISPFCVLPSELYRAFVDSHLPMNKHSYKLVGQYICSMYRDAPNRSRFYMAVFQFRQWFILRNMPEPIPLPNEETSYLNMPDRPNALRGFVEAMSNATHTLLSRNSLVTWDPIASEHVWTWEKLIDRAMDLERSVTRSTAAARSKKGWQAKVEAVTRGWKDGTKVKKLCADAIAPPTSSQQVPAGTSTQPPAAVTTNAPAATIQPNTTTQTPTLASSNNAPAAATTQVASAPGRKRRADHDAFGDEKNKRGRAG